MTVTIERLGKQQVAIALGLDASHGLINLMTCTVAKLSYYGGSCVVIQGEDWESFVVLPVSGKRFTDDEIAGFFQQIRELNVTTPLIRIETSLEPIAW